MSPRSRRSEARGGRSRWHAAPLVLLVALAPLAAALPAVPLDPDAPPQPGTSLPVDAPQPGAPLDIQEEHFLFQGRATSPSRVRVDAPDGATLLEYQVDAQGRARLDVAGTNAVSDATLVAVHGDPLGDSFTLVLRDATGATHEAAIDLAAMTRNDAGVEVPFATITRPLDWPGAPTQPYLLFVEDAAGNHRGAHALDGTKWFKLNGTHRAVVQLPVGGPEFERILLEVGRPGEGPMHNATFRLARETPDVRVYEADYAPVAVGGFGMARVELRPLYEARPVPLVVERFPEARHYAYRLDGEIPTVSVAAPAVADDFAFALAWDGADWSSGLAGFTVRYREAGQLAWSDWLEKSPPKTATFSGEWGRTYEFQVTAVDRVGNPSAVANATTRVVSKPGEVDDENDPPTAELLTPRAGALVAGVANVTWTAHDPDGLPPTSTLQLSADEGLTWRTLYSGTGTHVEWDTTDEADGPGYRLRLVVSDGTQQARSEVRGLTVRNVVAPVELPDEPAPEAPTPPTAAPDAPSAPQPAAPAGDGEAASPAADDAPPAAAGGKGVPAPFVGLALAGAALLARRRARG